MSANVVNLHCDPSSSQSVGSVIQQARERASREGLAYAGGLAPVDAWGLIVTGVATLLDVRTAEERCFVGRVAEGLHVPWACGTALNRNPRFVRDVEKLLPRDALVLLLCRSGKRSAQAAEALAKAGFVNVFNICEGFEGDLDDQGRRGGRNGWRHAGLPWVQD